MPATLTELASTALFLLLGVICAMVAYRIRAAVPMRSQFDLAAHAFHDPRPDRLAEVGSAEHRHQYANAGWVQARAISGSGVNRYEDTGYGSGGYRSRIEPTNHDAAAAVFRLRALPAAPALRLAPPTIRQLHQ